MKDNEWKNPPAAVPLTPTPAATVLPSAPPESSFPAAGQRSASPTYYFNFGVKHRGMDYKTVIETDPSYFFWAIDQPQPSQSLQHFIDWVYAHYTVDGDRVLNPQTLASFHAQPMVEYAVPNRQQGSRAAQQRREWQQIPKCEPICGPFSRKGSNACSEEGVHEVRVH